MQPLLPFLRPQTCHRPNRRCGRASRRFFRQTTSMAALVVIVILFVLAIIGPSIAPYDPAKPDYDAILTSPSAQHWLGTDEFGRDILSRIINGTRISLSVSLSSVLVGSFIGTLVGLSAGYYGGRYDSFVMRTCDVMFAFPGILQAIAIIAIVGPGLQNVVIAVTIYTIPIFVRIVRGSTLALKNMMYVEAARSAGIRDWGIIGRHIFPGVFFRCSRILHDAYRFRYPDCRFPFLPGPGRAAADARMGGDAEFRPGISGVGAACGAVPGTGDPVHLPGVQFARRRPQGRPGPQNRRLT